MRIGIFMLEHSPAHVPSIVPEVVRLLSEWDVKVETLHPERQLLDLAEVRVDNDIYILKTGTDLVWSVAGALHAAGARMLNPYPVAARMRDKIVATQILMQAGVPVPESCVVANPEQLAPMLARGPLVVKPYKGSKGRGVHTLWDPDELDELPGGEEPIFAQRYHKPQGLDRKIYCIGGQLFGVERVWPAHTYQEKLGRPFTIPPELREIALRCGRAFGVDLYGVDVIKSDGCWYVVDINSFPGFKGVPDAALRVADYIYGWGQNALGLARPAPRLKEVLRS